MNKIKFIKKKLLNLILENKEGIKVILKIIKAITDFQFE